MTRFNKKNILTKIDNMIEIAQYERDKWNSKTDMELWKYHHGEMTGLRQLKSMIIHNTRNNDCLQTFLITKETNGENKS